MSPEIEKFLELHGAISLCDWRERASGVVEAEKGDHLVQIIGIGGRVLLAWSGAKVRNRSYRTFEAGEYRVQTEEALKRIFS